MTEAPGQPKTGETREPSPRLIAFYLPQFHTIPENDVWWGSGYTEWTIVARAKPLFPGHYQPQIPADLGFYDLRLPEARQAQADLAREHGIHGFCYYHYWFEGRRLLQRPLEEMLESGHPDFPFCLCWANHTWTWKRDHSMQGRLAEQGYSEEDDREHIRWLLGVFSDRRYIRVNGRPLILIYWTDDLPDPARTSEIWREEAGKAGETEPYICKVDSFGNFSDPGPLGCDAATEFWPHAAGDFIERVQGEEAAFQENLIFDYRRLASALSRRARPDFKRFPCVVPRWDNTARWKAQGATLLKDSTPELYGAWLESVIHNTTESFEPEEQLVFINAWNEWGEGAYLEPDLRYGRAYLQATRQALKRSGVEVRENGHGTEDSPGPASTEELYRKLLERYQDLQRRFTERMGHEERSPLAQRAENRYDNLRKKHNHLFREHTKLGRHNERLRQKASQMEKKRNRLLKDRSKLKKRNDGLRKSITGLQEKIAPMEKNLDAAEEKYGLLASAIQHRASEARALISTLDQETRALLESRRWRIGDAAGNLLDRVLRRSQATETPAERLLALTTRFKEWAKRWDGEKP